MTELDSRQVELLEAFVDAWQWSGTPFDFPPDQPFAHLFWPPAVKAATRDEARQLRHLGLLDVDASAAPTWRLFPSAEAQTRFGDSDEQRVAAALADPDQRLGLILQATVTAFETRPDEPLSFWPMAGGAIVRHPGWPLAPDVVRAHDLQQLAELGLLSTAPTTRGMTFWPTADGRAAVHNAVGLLERRSEQASSEQEAARLKRWADRLRAGDLAVSVLAGTVTSVIRALIGL